MGAMPRVTLFVHDLAGNAVVRAAPLAAALARGHEVEVVGLLLSGDEVYAPYRGRVNARTIRCGPSTAAVLAAGPRLAPAGTGGPVYARQPPPPPPPPPPPAAPRGGGPGAAARGEE